MSAARWEWYGWGREGEGMSAEERAFVLGRYREKFGEPDAAVAVPALEALDLPPARLTAPAALAEFCTSERYDRAAHTYGKSYPDYVRAMLGDFGVAPTWSLIPAPRRRSQRRWISPATSAPC